MRRRLILYGVGARTARRCVVLCIGLGVSVDELFRVGKHNVIAARSAGDVVLYIREGSVLEFTRLPELWSSRLRRAANADVTSWLAVGGKPYTVAIRTCAAS